MRSPAGLAHRSLLIVALASSALLAASAAPADAIACGSETYTTRGVVRSFGKDRSYVNIAHEKIPGYMEAMTMSFEPKDGDQLRGLEAGDAVTFAFTATDDGRRVLQRITKVGARAAW